MTRSNLLPINLPVRLQCLRIPMAWSRKVTVGKDGRSTTFFVAEGNKTDPATNYNVKEKRSEFFRLKEGDDDAALKFLDSVGLFFQSGIRAMNEDLDNFRFVEAEDGSHMVFGGDYPLTSDDFWLQRRGVIHRWTGKPSEDWKTWEFSVRLAEFRGKPAAVITTLSFMDALAASIRGEQLEGMKFRKCKRLDCQELFTTSDRRKIYHDSYCAHITQVRESRRK